MLAAKPKAKICLLLKGELPPRNGRSMYSNERNANVMEDTSTKGISALTGMWIGRCLPVSYTHLDVYKRQDLFRLSHPAEPTSGTQIQIGARSDHGRDSRCAKPAGQKGDNGRMKSAKRTGLRSLRCQGPNAELNSAQCPNYRDARIECQ